MRKQKQMLQKKEENLEDVSSKQKAGPSGQKYSKLELSHDVVERLRERLAANTSTSR